MANILVEDARMQAQLALSESPVFALREVQVEQAGDALHLTGKVSCFYHKQLAQEAIRAIHPLIPLVNAIDVD